MRCVVMVLLAVAAPAYADEGDRFDGKTVVLQVAGGTGGALLGGATLGAIGLGIGQASAREGDWGAPLAGALFGVVAGGVAGDIIGVQLAGDHRRGTGRWWGTTAGAVVGLGVLAGVVPALERKHPPMWLEVGIVATTLLAGTIAGYHLTATDSTMTWGATVPF
jgi:hypothetical protein